ncbi:hypothetical protein ACM66B_001458 [Microbotryomycetes sp. NB124-2]
MPFLFGPGSSVGASGAPVVQVFRAPPGGGGNPLRSLMNGDSEVSDDERPPARVPPYTVINLPNLRARTGREQQAVLPAGISTVRIKMTMIEEVIEIVRSGHDKMPGPRLPSLPLLASLPSNHLGAPGGSFFGLASSSPSRGVNVLRDSSGTGGPSADYLRRAAVESMPFARKPCQPLVVFSIEAVLDCTLPSHSRGGYTDTLSRGFLHTLIDYVLHDDTPWCGVFFTSMPREDAVKTLKDLNLPVGGPESNERDSWLGLYAREDMKPGWSDEHGIKDLEALWAGIYQDHRMKFDLENTVVITSNPRHMVKQPHSFILVPAFEYISSTPADQDLVLLELVAALDDLLTETNFPYHIKQFDWDKVHTWAHVEKKDSASSIIRRAFMAKAAISICAKLRIPVIAFEGNFKWKTALRSDYMTH